jgi:F420-dependent oxidoreductase-like protein
MKLAVHCANLTWPGGADALGTTLAGVARAADEGGVTTVTLMDHYFQMEHLGGPPEPMLEGYTSLGFLAGQTSRLELGLLVTGVTYRHPGLLAKIVTTLDVLSEGRAFLGIGAAWYEREHLALGVPYPPLAERFERLEETLQIALQMWSDDEGPYAGKHFQLAETISIPSPVQTPHPPIVIGGSGERKTLRMVAQYAQATNLIVADADAAAHKLAVLREHCDDLGRDYDSIEKTAQARLQPGFTADEILETASALAAVGIEHVHFGVLGPDVPGSIARFGDEVAPRLGDIAVG